MPRQAAPAETRPRPQGCSQAAQDRGSRASVEAAARPAEAGDIAPRLGARSIERHVVKEATLAAQEAQAAAMRDVLAHARGGDSRDVMQQLQAVIAGASPDDAQALRHALFKRETELAPGLRDPDAELSANWREGGYPYKNLLSRKSYEKQKYRLQVELLKLQAWVKETGQRVVILFEGRDAAGKGGTIKRMMEHLNPRGARVVALEKPSEIERGQWYFQRYALHLPTRGEIVLFDRSWYNRAGVERVMGFCSDDEYLEFMRQAPEFERHLVRSGVHLVKLWFSVSRERAAAPLQGAPHAPAQAVEAEPDRPRLARPLGRLHARQGGDVHAHRHGRRAVDGDQVGLQEARAAERLALRAAPDVVHEQGPRRHRRARPAARRPGRAGARPGRRFHARQRVCVAREAGAAARYNRPGSEERCETPAPVRRASQARKLFQPRSSPLSGAASQLPKQRRLRPVVSTHCNRRSP